MRFKFKNQAYQSEAVQSVVEVFRGNKIDASEHYQRDLGIRPAETEGQLSLFATETEAEEEDELGYRNGALTLSDEELLRNIHTVQRNNNIKNDARLIKVNGVPALDVEMETGTGKTYVYIKTLFELNKVYGWSKFIVVVPSIAIREGVKKSFEITADHFFESYQKKVRFFIYNSKNLQQLDAFSSDAGINVMIINMQAFASSLKEDGKSKESRLIYTRRDDFGSRRPIDVLAANRPIVILDEPQKMGGKATTEGIKRFKPLFLLHYSATHKNAHNTVYVLDALDAYNKRLVKKIQVKGIRMSNIGGTGAYLYLSRIVLSPSRAPEARIEFEMAQKSGVARKTQTFCVGDSLYVASKNLEQYRHGHVITEIDPINNRVVLENGKELHPGETVGDMNEANLRRVQIRETIASHLEKEAELFEKGIKPLSLFFIDEVSKYRLYSEEGEELKGEYAKVFEEEYRDLLNEKLELFPSAYQQYLKGLDAESTHRGYFSIDKKGRCVNSEIKRGSDISDDISAYDLILKNKERLLSFDEPTRFIFSHSALREGWDNPNVFQICTLKHSDNTTARRQEVGRGLRLAVNQEGTRMDAESCGEREVHELNKLTVIAGESYASFVSALQAETREVLSERPRAFSVEYLEGKTIRMAEGNTHTINKEEAQELFHWVKFNKFIDNTGKVSEECRNAYEAGKIPEAKYPFSDLTSGLVEAGVTEENIHNLLRSVYDDSMLNSMTTDATECRVESNELNENFRKKEFQELWKRLNHKYAYTVQFDSAELIEKAVSALEKDLLVQQTSYIVNQGEQRDDLTEQMVRSGESFAQGNSKRAQKLKHAAVSRVGYDLVGKIAKATVLTRKTVAEILRRLQRKTLAQFAHNPEQFIAQVSQLILDQKAVAIVEHVSYNMIEGEYDNSIFTDENKTRELSRAFRAKKAVQPYVFTDGTADKSVERRFAEELDQAEEVCVYAKLPRGFKIPTPMGSYSPDWAIAFKEGRVKHIYFVAETKGNLSSLELRPIEQAKIDCARRLFRSISSADIVYEAVSSFDELMKAVGGDSIQRGH